MLIPFRRVQVKSDDVKHLQDGIAQIFNQILKKQIIDGIFIQDITITGGTPLEISHGLDNTPRGWIIVKKNAESDVWQTVSDTPSATMVLNATAATTVTISLWVF